MIISSDCIQLEAQAKVSQPPLAKKAAPLKAFFLAYVKADAGQRKDGQHGSMVSLHD
jgi:hypothetical protein